ncbi:DUF3846 domain-containing protein [Desulfosporosinus sp. FKA]|uniref:DUF3846 domain-containing protein n=1 Tax=Desulfosporosinus sp. FKA TaxID=1969834 RepID=UPI000B498F91|nr:DUF3846 domain-containing protein [Desulfosporosinus sp. FKA]
MRILVRKSNNSPLLLEEIEGTLEEIQEIIGGNMEIYPMSKGLFCIYNEDGKMKGLEKNFFHDYAGWILGTVIFVSDGGDEFKSLTDNQITFIKEYIGSPVVQ